MDCSPQAPLSMGFPRQEYWSGLSFLSPGDLPNPGIKLVSPALTGGFFTVEPKGSFRPIHPLRLGRGSFPPNQGNSPIPDQGTGAGNKERTWLVGRLRLDRVESQAPGGEGRFCSFSFSRSPSFF